MTRTRYVLPIIVLAALVGSASAAQVTLTDTWQNLGTGPLLISVVGGDGMFEASATAPTDSGQPIFRNQQPLAFNASTLIWGKRRSTNPGPTGSPVAIYSPVTVGGGGGAVTAAPGGATPLARVPSSAAAQGPVTVKTSAGRLYTYRACNTTAASIYLRFYNTATPTPGTTPVYSGPYVMPPTSCIQQTAFADDAGLYFSTAISAAFGTSALDSDATTITVGAITAWEVDGQ